MTRWSAILASLLIGGCLGALLHHGASVDQACSPRLIPAPLAVDALRAALARQLNVDLSSLQPIEPEYPELSLRELLNPWVSRQPNRVLQYDVWTIGVERRQGDKLSYGMQPDGRFVLVRGSFIDSGEPPTHTMMWIRFDG